MAAIAGLTLSSLTASGLTWLTGRPVRLAVPFVRRGHVVRSLAVCMFAGPVAMLNEVRATRPHDIRAILAATAAAVLWSSCLGVMTLTLVAAVLGIGDTQ